MSTSKPARRPRKAAYHHGDLRFALVGAAEIILEEQGLGAVTLREVARRAGVSHAAPYRHFADLDALLAAVAAEGFRRLDEEGFGRPATQMGEAYVAFALKYPQHFRLMFGGRLAHGAYPELREAGARSHGSLLEAFRARKDLGDPEAAAAAAWSISHGLANLLLDGHFARSHGGATEAFVRRVFSAIRFSAAARPA